MIYVSPATEHILLLTTPKTVSLSTLESGGGSRSTTGDTFGRNEAMTLLGVVRRSCDRVSLGCDVLACAVLLEPLHCRIVGDVLSTAPKDNPLWRNTYERASILESLTLYAMSLITISKRKELCPACNGKGYVAPRKDLYGRPIDQKSVECSVCSGLGYVATDRPPTISSLCQVFDVYAEPEVRGSLTRYRVKKYAMPLLDGILEGLLECATGANHEIGSRYRVM